MGINKATNKRFLLTEKQKEAIRRSYATGQVTMRNLAAQYGVHPATIHYVIHSEENKRK